ncbi:MAG: pirin family protein [Flavobacterium sp.]|uniref:pirin family protein n=1 Tax=Flavobacterium sp. TaxID=239 RepID=UPI0012175927|nr:pirin family protein [Flavobacterium sp.]RZJ67784.1 MAG: pirin family protein [Flavobacterium sp.]
MITELFPADKRGKADHGWLQANFSFSFANYFNPKNIQFGMLRVLNDDTIAAGAGFGTHPHDNMEIITIPLEGGLKHRDSMGNEGVIGFGEVQVMSAGTGILHSEMNASATQRAKTLQLWVFPEKQNVEPRYDQKSFDLENSRNSFVNVVSPSDKNDGNALWVYQQTWFNLGIFDSGKTISYESHAKNQGAYVFVLEGSIEIADESLGMRDAIGITAFGEFNIKVKDAAKLLIVEVPMTN